MCFFQVLILSFSSSSLFQDDAEFVKALLEVPQGPGGPRTPDQRSGGNGRGPSSGGSAGSPTSPQFGRGACFPSGPSPSSGSPADALISDTSSTNERMYISLLRAGSFPRGRSDSTGRNLLHYSCLFGFADLALRLLRARWDVNAADRYGCTPLHLAAYRGDLDIARNLLRYGASVTVRDDCGDTAAAIALRVREPELCRELLLHEYARRRVAALIEPAVLQRRSTPRSPDTIPPEFLVMLHQNSKDMQLTFSSEAAVKIQSLFRRYQARKYFLALRRSAVTIQSMYKKGHRISRVVINTKNN
jgi:ankyrin repeat protein